MNKNTYNDNHIASETLIKLFIAGHKILIPITSSGIIPEMLTDEDRKKIRENTKRVIFNSNFHYYHYYH